MNRIPLAAATAALLAALVAPQSLDAQLRPRRRAALAAHDAITRTINDCEDRTDDSARLCVRRSRTVRWTTLAARMS